MSTRVFPPAPLAGSHAARSSSRPEPHQHGCGPLGRLPLPTRLEPGAHRGGTLIVYIVIALVGALVMLAGVLQDLLWLIPIGGLTVIASFVWFARTQTSAPVEESGRKR